MRIPTPLYPCGKFLMSPPFLWKTPPLPLSTSVHHLFLLLFFIPSAQSIFSEGIHILFIGRRFRFQFFPSVDIGGSDFSRNNFNVWIQFLSLLHFLEYEDLLRISIRTSSIHTFPTSLFFQYASNQMLIYMKITAWILDMSECNATPPFSYRKLILHVGPTLSV